ncbi:hypothetical protein [Nonomuraea sp. NPDC050540]|uniref:hypothetical protein n=1 Tax=Nonomuraea sp. NPDC050540 TaxID=3364367 RepID=UPI0037987059
MIGKQAPAVVAQIWGQEPQPSHHPRPSLSLAPIDDVDCTRLPWDDPPALTAPAADDGVRRLPQAWPPKVPAPGADGWPGRAVGWLLEAMPPGYRAHRDVLAIHPLLLARSAYEDTVRARDAVRDSYRGAAVALRDQLPPEAITAVLEVHRAELAHLNALVRRSGTSAGRLVP